MNLGKAYNRYFPKNNLTNTIPIIRVVNEVIHIGIIISYGALEPAAALIEITVVGKKVTEEVLNIASIAIDGEILCGVLFSLSSSCIALTPIGVAALPIPRTFALKFAVIASQAFFEASGNSLFIIGENAVSTICKRPASSPIFNIPVQKHIIPANDNKINTLSFAPFSIASVVSGSFPFIKAHI